jgi:hypothetical protein
MAIDEELLKPSREYLAALHMQIEDLRAKASERARWYPYDEEYVRSVWHRFEMSVLPIRREIDGVGKVITDYYALQSDLPPVIVPQSDGAGQ